MRYEIFGDTGGHYLPLFRALKELGFDETTGKLPADVFIIHLGDLIHKGPDSVGVLELVQCVIDANPGQWIQLLGNHEVNYLPDGVNFWRDELPEEGLIKLGELFQKKAFRVAVALPPLEKIQGIAMAEEGFLGQPALLTHAGLTRGFLNRFYLEEDPEIIATKLNNLPLAKLTHPGMLLTGGGPSSQADPFWALSTFELWSSWKERGCSFIQIHGHTNPYDFFKKWWWATPAGFQEASRLDKEKHLTYTRVPGSLQIAVDPGFETESKTLPIQPHITVETF